MIELLHQLFAVLRGGEASSVERVNVFKKGDKEEPENYRRITLLSVVGKVFCKVA